MAYIEIKERNSKKYIYLVNSVRQGKKIKKERQYFGVDLSDEDIKERVKEKKKKELKGLNKIKKKLINILKKAGIKKAGVFGSYARGEETSKSDIDILIEPYEGMGLEYVGLAQTLEENLKKKVDLVSYRFISPLLKERILNDEIRVVG